jgi:hypothetical protein
MTGYDVHKNEWWRLFENANKVKKFADACQVTSVLITSKGEPFLNLEALVNMCNEFSQYPIEIQTNGLALNKKVISSTSADEINRYLNFPFDVIAFSIDKLKQLEEFQPSFTKLKAMNKIVRVTYNINDLDEDLMELCPSVDHGPFPHLLDLVKKYPVHQFSVRRLTIPEKYVDTVQAREAANWIELNTKKSTNMYWQLATGIKNLPAVRKLPFGATVYDYEGLGIASFDYCLQESHKEDDLRSLIYNEDGHVYTSWDSKASVLF